MTKTKLCINYIREQSSLSFILDHRSRILYRSLSELFYRNQRLLLDKDEETRQKTEKYVLWLSDQTSVRNICEQTMNLCQENQTKR